MSKTFAESAYQISRAGALTGPLTYLGTLSLVFSPPRWGTRQIRARVPRNSNPAARLADWSEVLISASKSLAAGAACVLAALADAAGLPVDEALVVLDQRTWRDAVDADWAMSSRSGITGVPTFVAGGRQAVGAQPESVLRGLLDAADAQPRLEDTRP